MEDFPQTRPIPRLAVKPKRRPVTLIVGIICKDGIVMAADSQTTWQTGKTWLTKKMTPVDHLQGRILIAESGSTITSGKTVEFIQEALSNPIALTDVTAPEIVRIAIRKTREQLRETHFNCESEELQHIIDNEDLNCGLMVAYYNDGADIPPALFTVKLTTCMVTKATKFYEVLGSGSDLADCLLTDLCSPDTDCVTAAAIAIHVVEAAKRFDPYCGGPPRIGIIRRNPLKYFDPPILLSEYDTQEMVKMVASVEEETRQKRNEILREAMKQRANRLVEQFMSRKTPMPGGKQPPTNL